MNDQLLNNSKILADNMSELRKARSLTQSTLAKLSGIPRSTITNFESGSGNPSLSNLVRLATALEVQVGELFSPLIKETKLIKRSEIPFKDKGDCMIYNLLPTPVKGLAIEKFEIPTASGFTGIPHLKGTKEYFTCVEGKATVIVAGESFNVTKGDILIFSGNEKHSYFNKGRTKAVAISILVNDKVFT